jgi:hypothetical protein
VHKTESSRRCLFGPKLHLVKPPCRLIIEIPAVPACGIAQFVVFASPVRAGGMQQCESGTCQQPDEAGNHLTLSDEVSEA